MNIGRALSQNMPGQCAPLQLAGFLEHKIVGEFSQQWLLSWTLGFR